MPRRWLCAPISSRHFLAILNHTSTEHYPSTPWPTAVEPFADLTEAIALNAGEPASLFFRGRWQIEAGAYAQGISDLRRAILADEALGSAYYADSARLSVAVACFLAKDFEQSELACAGLSPGAATYLAGRRWTIKDLRRF